MIKLSIEINALLEISNRNKETLLISNMVRTDLCAGGVPWPNLQG